MSRAGQTDGPVIDIHRHREDAIAANVTVEGLAEGDRLHPVQEAVLEEQAAQCGFCISGILVSAATLLDSDPRPSEAAVVDALDRNLCRCGVQRRIVKAVLKASNAS